MTGNAPLPSQFSIPVLSEGDYAKLHARLHDSLAACLRRCRIDESLLDPLCCVYLPLAAWVDHIKKPGTLVLGVAGAQGSGKSTLCEFLKRVLCEGYGHRVAVFSIDDLYKTRAERARLAADIHPLLKVRGVPGTHDIDLGLSLLDALIAAGPETLTPIPAFDKARDDRRPESEWDGFKGPADIIIIEGWCVGARPQPEAALIPPINELEAIHDSDGSWRQHVNLQLAGEYSRLFGRLNKLIMLKVPGMQSVYRWRRVQEAKLAAATDSAGPNRIMDDAELGRFIMHYERLTRAMLEEMPQRADLVLDLDEHQHFTHLGVNHPLMKVHSFHPPIRTLMGPGPSDVHPRILEALSRPTIGHLDPAFVGMMDEMKALLQYAFQTKNELTLPVSAPGSAGMETCFVNLVEPGDKVIVCQNGVFGGRMKENVERCGATAIMVEDAWGDAVDPHKVEAALKAHPDTKILAFVHAETSTGACSDVEELTRLAHQAGCLVIVDAVTSLGGNPLKLDAWGVDAIYSGSQKCLSCTPGLSPVSFGPRAVELINNRKTKCQSWFLDLGLVMSYWGGGTKRAYHHTAPINALYGLHEALVLLQEEGLENAWKRHSDLHLALRAGLEAMGLSLLVAEKARLPQLNAVRVPKGIDEAAVRSALLNRYGLEIGAGLGSLAGKVWRIGLMGFSATPRNVLFCLSALEAVLGELGSPTSKGVAIPAAQTVLAAKGY